MKIFINTASQPPTLAATFSSKTDATGELRVFSSSFGSGISSLRFKRGTVVPLEIAFPAAEGFAPPATVRFGLKPTGQYDGALAAFAESVESKTEEDGTLVFSMSAEIASALIDAQLGVGGDGTADDKATASFVAEFAWDDADGNTVATTTVPATVENNVIRDGDAAAGVNPGGDWAALMVVRMAWADYCALENKADDVIYVCPDAPREIEEHNADKAAHPALVQALTEMIQTLLGNVQLDDETAARILAELSEVRAAARAASADAAAVRTAMNTDFAKFEAGTSTAETGAKHGKSLLASQSGEDGGFYVGANRSATRAWTQYMTRYRQTGVRAYGATNGEYEDYLWAPRTEDDEPLRVARMKDFDRIVNPTLVVSTEGEKTEEPDENANMTAWIGTLGALKGLEEDDASAIVPDAVSVWRRTKGTTVNGTLNMRMKIMRWDEASGAWAIAAKSKETRIWNNFANGEEIKFTFAWEGDGIPANEKVIIGFVRMSDEDAAGTFTQASCAQTTTRSGSMTVAPGLSTREPAVQEYAPVMRLGTARVLTPADIEALIADAESGGGGSGVTEEWVRNNFVPLSGGNVEGDLRIGYTRNGTFYQAVGLNHQTGSADFSGILTAQIGDFANLRVFDRNESGAKVPVFIANPSGVSTSLNISTTGTLTVGGVDVGATLAELTNGSTIVKSGGKLVFLDEAGEEKETISCADNGDLRVKTSNRSIYNDLVGESIITKALLDEYDDRNYPLVGERIANARLQMELKIEEAGAALDAKITALEARIAALEGA